MKLQKHQSLLRGYSTPLESSNYTLVELGNKNLNKNYEQ